MDITRYDLYRLTGKTDTATFVKCFVNNKAYRKLVYYRRYQTAGSFGRFIIKVLNHFISNKMSIDLPFTVKIGKGLQILHPYSIAFNSGTVIGDNCTVLKGATLGNSKTGKVGTPVVGNNVYIGLNATIVGGGYSLEIM